MRLRQVVPPLRSIGVGGLYDRWARGLAVPLYVTARGNTYVTAFSQILVEVRRDAPGAEPSGDDGFGCSYELGGALARRVLRDSDGQRQKSGGLGDRGSNEATVGAAQNAGAIHTKTGLSKGSIARVKTPTVLQRLMHRTAGTSGYCRPTTRTSRRAHVDGLLSVRIQGKTSSSRATSGLERASTRRGDHQGSTARCTTLGATTRAGKMVLPRAAAVEVRARSLLGRVCSSRSMGLSRP